jgi:ATP-binding cassette subfamily F protein 3
MLYQISNGAVELGAELILKNINFEIRNTEKIAVVGRNGCGKTTLLKLISGEVDLLKRDSDEDIFIAKSGNPEIGYLKQMAFDDYTITLDEEIRKVFRPILAMQERMEYLLSVMNGTETVSGLSEHVMSEELTADDSLHEREIREYTRLREEFEDIGGYYYEKEYETMLKQFGFVQSDKAKKLNEFSGGQLTKLAFIKLLLSKPDILLLDEPTNHLDITTIEWLEEYLKSYKKAVVIVSHDRMFLDKIVDVVYEI